METSLHRQPFTIGILAKEAGVTVETVRYYQRRRLLRQPQRPLNGVRSYDEADLVRLRLIKRAQQLGFTLTEIDDLIVHVEGGACRAVKLLARDKLENIDSRIDVLEKVRDTLKSLVGSCKGKCPEPCPVICSFRSPTPELIGLSPEA